MKKFTSIGYIVIPIIIIIISAVAVIIIKTNDAKKVMNNLVGNNTNQTGYNKRINEILADSKEVERKWLINKENIPYDLNAEGVYKYEIKQTYLCFDPEMRVRNYNNGESFEFTVKDHMTQDGLVRDETNIEITKEQYENLLKKKEENTITINKTRYQLYDDNQIVAIDIFHGELDGLAYMEIEFKNEEESNNYKEPAWVIKDVTADKAYKNGHLARYGIPNK